MRIIDKLRQFDGIHVKEAFISGSNKPKVYVYDRKNHILTLEPILSTSEAFNWVVRVNRTGIAIKPKQAKLGQWLIRAIKEYLNSSLTVS